jgi:uncharacterized Zn ribbon protein
VAPCRLHQQEVKTNRNSNQCLHCGRPNPVQRCRPQRQQHCNDDDNDDDDDDADDRTLDCDGNELKVDDRVLVVSNAKWKGKICRIVERRDGGWCMIQMERGSQKEPRRYLSKSLQLVL